MANKKDNSTAAAREQRAAAKPRRRVSAEAADEDGELEEGSIDVPTLTEDPTAPMQADDDDAADENAARAAAAVEEAEETRIDGVDETTSMSFNDTSESTGKHHGILAEGEDGDGESEEMARAAPVSAATGDAFDITAAENDEANRFLSTAFPEYAAEYAAAGPKANPIPVAEVRVDSAEVVAWRCPGCGKTWRCGVFVRCILKNSCPTCTAAHTTTMATTRPDLLQLWDYSRNNPFVKPDEIAADSREMVHWSCPTCGDSYTARVRDRVVDKVRCPTCALSQSTSAAATTADSSALQQEWHPLKNGDLRLDQLAPLDRKTKVWWLCGACGHEWEASLAVRLSRHRRAKGKSCPVCHGKGTTDVL